MVDRWLLPLIVRIRVESAERERGDIPGWVMITLMTVAVSMAIWGLVNGSIMNVLTNALNGVTGNGPTGGTTPPGG
ncbi:MAG: hypothetical protein ABI912_09745 [Actinomycetota bacterium]